MCRPSTPSPISRRAKRSSTLQLPWSRRIVAKRLRLACKVRVRSHGSLASAVCSASGRRLREPCFCALGTTSPVPSHACVSPQVQTRDRSSVATSSVRRITRAHPLRHGWVMGACGESPLRASRRIGRAACSAHRRCPPTEWRLVLVGVRRGRSVWKARHDPASRNGRCRHRRNTHARGARPKPSGIPRTVRGLPVGDRIGSQADAAHTGRSADAARAAPPGSRPRAIQRAQLG